jgi:hypothetical protein
MVGKETTGSIDMVMVEWNGYQRKFYIVVAKLVGYFVFPACFVVSVEENYERKFMDEKILRQEMMTKGSVLIRCAHSGNQYCSVHFPVWA